MAVCALAQGLLTFYLIGSKPIYPVLGLLFAATLGIYNFSILISKPKQSETSAHRRIRWFFAHYRLMVTLTIAAILSLVPLFFMLATASQILLIFLGVLSFCYALPLFTIGEQKFGLRNIPGLKLLLIALVWAMSCVLLPILEAQDVYLINISMRDTTLLIAKQFLFTAALAIPFDIRDLFEDKQLGLKTIPVAWGEKSAYLLCQIFLIGYVILLFLSKNNDFSAVFGALALSAVVAGWLIFKSKKAKNEYYYFFYLDGILILQCVLVVCFQAVGHGC